MPDEGVYQVIIDIVLSHPPEFPNLFPMMGIFHMAKVALHFAGKYLKENSIDIALILARCFGSNTIESALSGGHYVRSLLGMQIFKQGFEILKWNAFWAEHTSDEWDAIKKLRLKSCSKVSKDLVVAFDELYQIISKVKTEMENFENQKSKI